jgi:hypothetical protein
MAHVAELRGTQGNRQTQAAAIRVTKFRLMNADTDQPVPAYDPLLNNSRIDVSTLPTTNLNVEAFTDGAVGSLQWKFDGTLRNENVAPWALCGNSGRDFFACTKLKQGVTSVISVTPFTGTGATGTAGTGLSIGVEFFKSNPVPSRLWLMTAEFTEVDDVPIQPLDNTTIYLFLWAGQVNVRAEFDTNLVKSVLFYYDGRVYRVDNGAPYSLAGNKGNNFFPWEPAPSPGKHNITAVAYTEADAKGVILSRVSASFNVIGADVTPPKLLDLKALSPLVADVRNGPATIKLQATLQDDVSGNAYSLISATLNDGSAFPRSPRHTHISLLR